MACNKHKHSRGGAEAQLKSLKQIGHDDGRLEIYFCIKCQAYHVGHRKMRGHVNKYQGERRLQS